MSFRAREDLHHRVQEALYVSLLSSFSWMCRLFLLTDQVYIPQPKESVLVGSTNTDKQNVRVKTTGLRLICKVV